MTDYGVQPTGFVRKPLPVILAEIEAANRTEFGSGVVQDAVSPLGQWNGLAADLVAKVWELAEDSYQSYDPDAAEGLRLDMLGRIRLLQRAGSETDASYRQGIINAGEAQIDLHDIARAVASLPGVTYTHIFENNDIDTDDNGMPAGSLCVALTGGDNDSVANAIRSYVVPGVKLYGNTALSGVIDGYCRTLRVLRPTEVSVDLTVRVRLKNDANGCPPPSVGAIETAFAQKIYLINGETIDHYKIRSIIESQFAGVEVVSFIGERDGTPLDENTPVLMNFFERAVLGTVVIAPV
jgi:hypothetical protein